MPFEFRATGESMEDLATQLQAAALTITAGLERVEADPPPEAKLALDAYMISGSGSLELEEPLGQPIAAEEPKKRRGRPKKEETPERLQSLDLPPEPVEEEEEDPFEGAATAEPKMTAQEAKAEAMNLLQRVWLQNKDGIRRLQTEFGVKKFIDVPAERGHELLAAVQAVAVEQAA